MSEVLKIRLAARCEAAGRPENEDNYQVADNLSIGNFGFQRDKIFPLSAKGALLLVCDGMGGMNAGEVASAVGVDTIKGLFAPQFLTDDIFANDDSICMYMKRAIIKADSRIKEEASKDAAKQGMGSTAVMAWLLGQKVYVAWCGDSRCYRYNPATGLERLSHDHSYVQDLVDTGQLSPELAFDHPNKNIITRSLGDPRGAAKPDAKVYPLHEGDVILLCSDGLSDSLRDSEIEQSISRSLSSMEVCRDALWNDSKRAGWHDNVTVVLAQVVGENAGQTAPQSQVQMEPVQPTPQPVAQPAPQPQPQPEVRKPASQNGNSKKMLAIIVIAVLLLAGLTVGYVMLNNGEQPKVQQTEQVDLSQVKQEIDKIIDAKSAELADNFDKDLLSVAYKSQSEEVNKYIINELKEKYLYVDGLDDDFLSKEIRNERLNKINNVINQIEAL